MKSSYINREREGERERERQWERERERNITHKSQNGDIIRVGEAAKSSNKVNVKLMTNKRAV